VTGGIHGGLALGDLSQVMSANRIVPGVDEGHPAAAERM